MHTFVKTGGIVNFTLYNDFLTRNSNHAQAPGTVVDHLLSWTTVALDAQQTLRELPERLCTPPSSRGSNSWFDHGFLLADVVAPEAVCPGLGVLRRIHS